MAQLLFPLRLCYNICIFISFVPLRKFRFIEQFDSCSGAEAPMASPGGKLSKIP